MSPGIALRRPAWFSSRRLRPCSITLPCRSAPCCRRHNPYTASAKVTASSTTPPEAGGDPQDPLKHDVEQSYMGDERNSASSLLQDAIRTLPLKEADILNRLTRFNTSRGCRELNPKLSLQSGWFDEGYPLQGLTKSSRYNNIGAFLSSPYISPPRRYPTRAETAASYQKYRQSAYQFIYGEQNYRNVDWEVALIKLMNFTNYPGVWLSRVVEVFLSDEQITQLRQGEELRFAIWELEQQTCTRIQVARNHLATDPSMVCSLILSGEEMQIRECINVLVNKLGRFKLQKRQPDDETVPPPMTPAYPVMQLLKMRNYRVTQVDMTADEIPVPPVWNKVGLERYIGRLVTSIPNVAAMRKYAERNEEHLTCVTRILCTLLGGVDDNIPREALSLNSFKLALWFMATKASIVTKPFWALFNAMEELNIPYDLEVFNILLMHSARADHSIRFCWVLGIMNRRGFHPNLLSWMMFMRMLKMPHARRRVYLEARDRGLFRHERDKASMAKELVEFDLENCIRSCHRLEDFKLEEFMAQQDAEYGARDWFNRDVFDRVVDILGRFGLYKCCFSSMMGLARERGFLPTNTSYNNILTHVVRQPGRRNTELAGVAISVVYAMQDTLNTHLSSQLSRHNPKAYKPDMATFELLFRIAWKLRLPNYMAVIWRYALMSGTTGNTMRLCVVEYLARGTVHSFASQPLPLRNYVRHIFTDRVVETVTDRDIAALYRSTVSSELGLLSKLLSASSSDTQADGDLARGLPPVSNVDLLRAYDSAAVAGRAFCSETLQNIVTRQYDSYPSDRHYAGSVSKQTPLKTNANRGLPGPINSHLSVRSNDSKPLSDAEVLDAHTKFLCLGHPVRLKPAEDLGIEEGVHSDDDLDQITAAEHSLAALTGTIEEQDIEKKLTSVLKQITASEKCDHELGLAQPQGRSRAPRSAEQQEVWGNSSKPLWDGLYRDGSWFKHGCDVAIAYERLYAGWKMQWPLGKALSIALQLDIQLRKHVEIWWTNEIMVREKRRNFNWLQDKMRSYKRPPPPIVLPVVNDRNPTRKIFGTIGPGPLGAVQLGTKSMLQHPIDGYELPVPMYLEQFDLSRAPRTWLRDPVHDEKFTLNQHMVGRDSDAN